MEDIEGFLLEHASVMSTGDTERLDCPACYKPGGERFTMTLRRQAAGAYAKCYRASCGYSRWINRPAWSTDAIKPAHSPERPFTRATEPLTDRDVEWFERLLPIMADRPVEDELRRRMMRSEGRYLLPVDRPWPIGAVVAKVWRTPWRSSPLFNPDAIYPGPKSIMYREAQGPLLAWYADTTALKHEILVIVEDQLSAMRLWLGWQQPAVALMGVGMSRDQAAQLQRYAGDVVIALDADATDTAFKLARGWGAAFNSCRVRLLERDYKDMDIDEITESLRL